MKLSVEITVHALKLLRLLDDSKLSGQYATTPALETLSETAAIEEVRTRRLSLFRPAAEAIAPSQN